MELRVLENDLELVGIDSGGSEILHYNGLPFTGFLVEYYPSGQLLAEDEFQNGYLEGWHREYHENGQLELEYNLHNNEVVPDTFKEYDKNGNFLGGF